MSNAPKRGLRRFEKDETQALHKLILQMNNLHAKMGGRTHRPERKALSRCIQILQRENDRKWAEFVDQT
jgi:hypothetical protein